MDEINVIEEKFTRCPRCRSFSVKKCPLTFQEKLKEHVVPVAAHKCSNCDHRFVYYGKFSDALKQFFSSESVPTGKKWLVAMSPLIIAVIVAALFLIPWSGDGQVDPDKKSDIKTEYTDRKDIKAGKESKDDKENKENIISDGKEATQKNNNETQPDETSPIEPVATDNKDQETPGGEDTQKDKGESPVTTDQMEPDNQTKDQQKDKTETDTVSPSPLTGEIIIGLRNRFGVNWVTTEKGVKITRLSNGPLKSAGLKVGDVFAEVDGQKVKSGNYLEKLRNDVFFGRRDEALIKVQRADQPLYFKLIKEKKEKKTESPETAAINSTDSNQPPSLTQRDVHKVASRSTIKIRKSAPNNENISNRWYFLKRKLTVTRASHQRVFLAGSSEGTGPWGVDDKLIINGKIYDGLSGVYDKTSGVLPENVKREPLDITNLVQSGRPTILNIRLADHGICWGNTDLYVVVK